MVETVTTWLSSNLTEFLGAFLGLVYIILSVRQNIFTWPVGVASSILYVIVFFEARFYANTLLQFYYVGMGIYGWYYWLKGKRDNPSGQLPVSRLTTSEGTKLGALVIPLIGLIYYILSAFTDSPVPFMDAVTTSLSIVGTWMLARKILFNWIVWIVADLAAAGLYLYRGLYPTAILYLVYTILAVYGYLEWKKSVQKPEYVRH